MDVPWIWPLDSIPILPDEPGQFAAVRTHDIHTGIDLYCELGTNVRACEDGLVTNIPWFTGQFFPTATSNGEFANWWNDTKAIMISGKSGVIVYGEVEPNSICVNIGDQVSAGQILGKIGKAVLKQNKGRPMVMLHIELMSPGLVDPIIWLVGQEKPFGLLDPTPFLIASAPYVTHFDLTSYDGRLYIDPEAPTKPSRWWEVWRK